MDGISDMQAPKADIRFAGSDCGSGWLGSIDGAVGSALRTSGAILTSRKATSS